MRLTSLGLALACIAICSAGRADPRLQVAITIDDLPLHAPYPPGVTPEQVGSQMAAALQAGRVPAIGFVNAFHLQRAPDTEEVLASWRKAGLVLGNHGWAHRALSQMTPTEFEDELTKGEPLLEKLGTGTDWRWFRYPFLDEGKDEAQRIAARQILSRHGYRVAHVTMGFSDWAFTPAYARCASLGNAAALAQLEGMYMDSARENLAVAREAAHKLYGRDIPYVLLMHVSALSAKMMPQVIELYRHAGFRFVTITQAERDPVYRAYTQLSLAPPPSQVEIAKRKGVVLRQSIDLSAKLASMCPAAVAASSR